MENALPATAIGEVAGGSELAQPDSANGYNKAVPAASADKPKRRKPKTFRIEFPLKDAEAWKRELLGTPLGSELSPDLAQVLKSFVSKQFSDYIKRRFDGSAS